MGVFLSIVYSLELLSSLRLVQWFGGFAGSRDLLVRRMVDIVRRLAVAELAILTTLTFSRMER